MLRLNAVVIILTFGAPAFVSAQDEEATGSLGVTTTPQDVDIWMDGQKIGFGTPYLIDSISPGLHRLILASRGYKTWRDTVRVSENEITSLDITLDTFIFDPEEFVPHNIDNFYDLDHEKITLDLSNYRGSRMISFKIDILDMFGNVFRTQTGKQSLPEFITWDGRGNDSTDIIVPGEVYTFIFELRMKGGGTVRRIGNEVIDVNGITLGNLVAVKESELAFIGAIPPPGVAKYYDYVVRKFDSFECTHLTVKASSLEFAKPITSYLGLELPYAVQSVIEDGNMHQVEFTLY